MTRANGGVSVARNRGFPECTSELVVFQDQDDRIAEGALERGRAILQKDPTVEWSLGVPDSSMNTM